MTLRYLVLGAAVSLGLFAAMLSIVGAFAQPFLLWTLYHTRLFWPVFYGSWVAMLLIQCLRRGVRSKPGRVGQ